MLPTQPVDRLPNIGAKRAALYEKLGVRTMDESEFRQTLGM